MIFLEYVGSRALFSMQTTPTLMSAAWVAIST